MGDTPYEWLPVADDRDADARVLPGRIEGRPAARGAEAAPYHRLVRVPLSERLFAGLNGQRYATYAALRDAILDVYAEHAHEMPMEYSYVDLIRYGLASGKIVQEPDAFRVRRVSAAEGQDHIHVAGACVMQEDVVTPSGDPRWDGTLQVGHGDDGRDHLIGDPDGDRAQCGRGYIAGRNVVAYTDAEHVLDYVTCPVCVRLVPHYLDDMRRGVEPYDGTGGAPLLRRVAPHDEWKAWL